MKSSKIFLFFVVAFSLLAGCSRDPKVARDKYFNSAQQYLKDGRYEEAAIQFRNALQKDNGHIPSYLGMAKAFQQMGNHQNAVGVYQQVLKLDGSNVEARLRLGQYLLASALRDPELFKKAQQEAEAIVKVEPSNVEAHLLLGNAYAGQNDADKSLQEIEKAVALDPGNQDASINLGAALMRNKDTARAEKTFRDVLDKNPNSTKAHLAMATFLAANQRLPEAEAQFRKAFDLAPAEPICLYALVSFYMSAKRTVEAENVFKEAIAKKPDALEPRWGLAGFYRQQGSVEKEMAALGELLKASPEHRPAALRVAEIHLGQNNDAKAEEGVRALLARNKNDAEAHYLLGKILLDRRETDKALAEFETAIKSNEAFLPAHLEKANLLLGRGDPEGAQNALNAVLQRDRNNLLARGALAKVLALRQKPQDAMQEAQAVLAAMPDSEDALYARGEALHSLGRLKESKEDFLKLCRLRPENPLYWHRLGVAEILQGDSAAALSHFRKALEVKPDFIVAANDLVYLHLQAKKIDAALAEVDQWSKMKAPQDEVHRFRGQIYLAKGDAATAEGEFRKTIEVNPQNYQAYILLAQLNMQQNKVPQALKEVDQLIAQNNKLAPAYLLKGYYLQVSKDIQGAIASYRKALDLDPENPIVSNNLAWVLCENNLGMEEALSLARNARKKLPDEPEIADTLGWIYYRMKSNTLAIDQLLLGVNNSRQPAAEKYYHLGMAYFAKGDVTLAKQTLQKSLDLNPNFPGAEEARSILKRLS